MLTKNQRTHYILLTDWTQINITKAQAELYKSEVELKQHNKFLTINDIDTEEILFNWRCSEIKRFVERKINSDYMNSRRWVCWYWIRHRLESQWICECNKKVWVTSHEFKDRLRKLWFTIDYDSDINQKMIDKYKLHYNY